MNYLRCFGCGDYIEEDEFYCDNCHLDEMIDMGIYEPIIKSEEEIDC